MEAPIACAAFRNSHGTRKCIINGACAVLHNIAMLLKEPMEDGEVEDEMNDVNDVYYGPDQGRAVRNHICRTFFS